MSLAPPFARCLRLPVIVAPMFLVSGPALITAACRSGVAAALPTLNQRTREGLAQWLRDIWGDLARAEDASGQRCAPFGVNLIVHKSNVRLDEDLAEVCAARVPFVVTSLGAVADVVARIHDYGGVVLHDVTNTRHAEKAIEAGVDGLIAVAAGAGGHAGTINPFALVAEMRAIAGKKMVALAGAISRGADVAAAVAAGADVAYMGTRFLAASESLASADYKQMVLSATAKDIVYTDKVSGVPANFLASSLARAGYDAGGLKAAPNLDLGHEAKAWSSIWSAGHGVGAITSCPSVAEIVNDLERDFAEARERLQSCDAR